MPTDATITRRCAKILPGVTPEHVLGCLDTMPEPLHGIAMDYFTGALPTTSITRSTAMKHVLADIVERVKTAGCVEIDEVRLEQRR
jgi:hypothetical protein